MKTIAIFNEKGGTGKTTVACLFSDYLAYALGQTVVALDFDAPSFHFHGLRQTDLSILEGKTPSDGSLMRLSAGNTPYHIVKVDRRRGSLDEVCEFVRKSRISGDGYMVLDFAGSYEPGDPAHTFIMRGLVDLVAIPVDLDKESQRSALYILMNTHHEKFIAAVGRAQNCVCFWNREDRSARLRSQDPFAAAQATFEAMGFEFTSGAIYENKWLRNEAVNFGFVRNTLCWPGANISRSCPYLVPLFEELKARLDGTFPTTNTQSL